MSLEFFRKREFIWLVVLAVIFVFLRLPATDSPYHQDEYKWPTIVNPALTEPGGIPHPPVGEFIYKIAGKTIGYDNFRFVPLVFSFVNLFLLFYLVKMIFGGKTAFWSVFLFAISFYSVLASLMVDTDGAIMPLFFLISAISYYKLRSSNFEISKEKWKWLFLLVFSIILGFLVKVSFALVPAALILDFAFEKNIFGDWKKLIKWLLYIAGGAGLLALILYLSTFVFPFFRLDWSLKYWEHFAKFNGRGWFQTFIQFAKAILYTSPLLLFPLFFIDREIWKKTRPFFLFIFVGLFFYLIAFDFSLGALDRYFQFLVVPLCIISGAIFAKLIGEKDRISKKEIIFISIISVLIFSIQFFKHYVPSLYPKTEWISRVFSLKWNFLYPFSGGSGPLPFYVSFAFMALIWVYSFVSVIPAFIKNNFKKQALIGILILGLLYNAVFIEEYLFGKINGSAPKLVEEATVFIKNNPEIKKVVVYNDNGGYQIQKTEKYSRRFYATPQFEETYKEFFKDFSGHILYIDIPKIEENTFYSNYLNSCEEIYEKQDKYIIAMVLDCSLTK